MNLHCEGFETELVSRVKRSSPFQHFTQAHVMSTGLSPQLQDSVFSEYETDLTTLITSISAKLSKDVKQQRGG